MYYVVMPIIVAVLLSIVILICWGMYQQNKSHKRHRKVRAWINFEKEMNESAKNNRP